MARSDYAGATRGSVSRLDAMGMAVTRRGHSQHAARPAPVVRASGMHQGPGTGGPPNLQGQPFAISSAAIMHESSAASQGVAGCLRVMLSACASPPIPVSRPSRPCARRLSGRCHVGRQAGLRGAPRCQARRRAGTRRVAIVDGRCLTWLPDGSDAARVAGQRDRAAGRLPGRPHPRQSHIPLGQLPAV